MEEEELEEHLLVQSSQEGLRRRIWLEMKELWRVAGPAILSRISSYGMFVVTQAFMGSLGETELAAYALVFTAILRFSNGILLGMGSALETFCGQAFGAKQYHMMGIYLQRSWLVILAAATCLLPIYVFAAPILRLLGQSEELSKVAGKIAYGLIPMNYYFVFYFTTQTYLQSQLKNSIIAWVSGAAFVIHGILSWILVKKLELGIAGALGSLAAANWLSLTGQLVYVFGGGCPDTWKGFSKHAFDELWPVLKLSVSSGVMLCLELWYNSVLILLAGYMKDAEVAISAFSICLNMTAWELMIPLGFLAAASVRVANELGRGDAGALKFAIKVAFATSLSIGVMFFIFFLGVGSRISYAFTSSKQVAKAVGGLKFLLSFSVLLNSVQPVLTGVALGAGWQSIVAYVNICCYYVVGIPLGVLLGYLTSLQVTGIWTGMVCGVAAQTLVLIIITKRTDWELQVEKAKSRLSRWLLPSDTESHGHKLQIKKSFRYIETFTPSKGSAYGCDLKVLSRKVVGSIDSVSQIQKGSQLKAHEAIGLSPGVGASAVELERGVSMDGKLDERLLSSPSTEEIRRPGLGRKIWVESGTLWRVAGPAIITRLAQFGMFVVTQSFMGHIGDAQLSAYALVQTVIMRFANGILLGMGSALETFCGQAFGAGQYRMMGIYMQRSWVVLLFVATILIPINAYTTEIFLSMGQDEQISRLAGPISLWFIPINYYYVFSFTLQMFLQAQLKNAIIAWAAASCFLLHILLSWVFVDVCHWGVNGAMGSVVLSCWLSIIGQFIYIFGGWCRNTWCGFSWLAFRELGPVIKLSLASGVMICLELWYNSVLVILAGYMPNAEVAINAFSICLNIVGWELMISLGFLSAASVRVANELGRGDASAAKFAILTVSGTSLAIGLIFFILFLALGGVISYAFTSSVEVADEVHSLRVYLSFSVLLNSIQPVLSGVALGAGWQHIVAFVNIGSYYVLGIPLGAVLAYVAHLSIRGFWIGMISGVAIQTLVLIIVTSKTDWNKQVDKASHRINKWVVPKDEEAKNGTRDIDIHHG
ncbi:hypothetical protein H6P81_002978 [Aristolochia fimbriata]|uniref:Protein DETOXIFICATION n=1 Tax=Aristolochia fimbriata TaxID=158543 RepID=A0AAV7FE72_ARIFI|nr:hypothetical protein H6P81_002978 [Aristolochia fimbriata]